MTLNYKKQTNQDKEACGCEDLISNVLEVWASD